MRCRLGDIVEFNPKEYLPRGIPAKKIPMDKLIPFCRDIDEYLEEIFYGGSKFKNGDTIMARITPCLENGKTSKVSILNDDEIGFGSTEYIVLRAIENISDPDYIYYLSISPHIRELAIKSMVGTSGRQRVQLDVIKNIDILCPSYLEQKKIGLLLKIIDDKIKINRQINDNLEQQVLALFYKYIISKVDFIKNGIIGDYCDIKSGYAFKSNLWTSSGIRVIKIKNIESSGLNIKQCSFVENDKINIARDFLVTAGDIIIAMTGATIGKFTIIPYSSEVFLVNQRVGKFFLDSDPINRLPFLYCTLKQKDIITEIINRGQGSAQPNISPSDILMTSCYYPSLAVIEKFNKYCKPYFDSMIINDAKKRKLETIRDTLLPKLMSGEIDVSNIEIQDTQLIIT